LGVQALTLRKPKPLQTKNPVALPLLREDRSREKKRGGKAGQFIAPKKSGGAERTIRGVHAMSKFLGFSEASCFFIEEKVLEWGFSKMGGGKV